MMEFLQNMDQALIIVGFLIGMISGGLFFATWSDHQFAAMRYCLVGFGFGLLLFFLGWAVPNPPEPKEPSIVELAPVDRIDKMYNDCITNARNDDVTSRTSCITVVKGKLELYKQLENETNVPRALPTPDRKNNPQPAVAKG